MPSKTSFRSIAVIPAFNEEQTVGAIVGESKQFVDEIIVVDDGSSDATALAAKNAGATVLRNIVNMGKGSALRTGIKVAISKGADIVVTLDADAQHDPKDIKKLLSALKKGDCDIVFGSRLLRGRMPLVKQFGNWFIYNSSRIFFGVDVKDTQTGFKAFRANVFKSISWESSGYALESEVVKNIGKHGLRLKEIPIKTIYSDDYKGTSVIDGMKIFFYMVYWKIFG